MLSDLIQSIPNEAGSYLLWLRSSQPRELSVGRLGTFCFPLGDYLYTGSAGGPGGLRVRLGRHLRGEGKVHWHIDYLRAAADLRGAGWQVHTAQDQVLQPPAIPRECAWSQELAKLPGFDSPVPGFGASDCRAGCTAHLVYISQGVHKTIQQITDQTGLRLWDLQNMVYLADVSTT